MCTYVGISASKTPQLISVNMNNDPVVWKRGFLGKRRREQNAASSTDTSYAGKTRTYTTRRQKRLEPSATSGRKGKKEQDPDRFTSNGSSLAKKKTRSVGGAGNRNKQAVMGDAGYAFLEKEAEDESSGFTSSGYSQETASTRSRTKTGNGGRRRKMNVDNESVETRKRSRSSVASKSTTSSSPTKKSRGEDATRRPHGGSSRKRSHGQNAKADRSQDNSTTQKRKKQTSSGDEVAKGGIKESVDRGKKHGLKKQQDQHGVKGGEKRTSGSKRNRTQGVKMTATGKSGDAVVALRQKKHGPTSEPMKRSEIPKRASKRQASIDAQSAMVAMTLQMKLPIGMAQTRRAAKPPAAAASSKTSSHARRPAVSTKKSIALEKTRASVAASITPKRNRSSTKVINESGDPLDSAKAAFYSGNCHPMVLQPKSPDTTRIHQQHPVCHMMQPIGCTCPNMMNYSVHCPVQSACHHHHHPQCHINASSVGSASQTVGLVTPFAGQVQAISGNASALYPPVFTFSTVPTVPAAPIPVTNSSYLQHHADATWPVGSVMEVPPGNTAFGGATGPMSQMPETSVRFRAVPAVFQGHLFIPPHAQAFDIHSNETGFSPLATAPIFAGGEPCKCNLLYQHEATSFPQRTCTNDPIKFAQSTESTSIQFGHHRPDAFGTPVVKGGFKEDAEFTTNAGTKAKRRNGNKDVHASTSSLWQPVGQSTRKWVYLNNDARPVRRQCFEAIKHKTEEEVIRTRDCVIVNSDDQSTKPYVAKVAEFFLDSSGLLCASIVWYYWPDQSEVEFDDQRMVLNNVHPKELFASRHVDSVPVDSIEDMAYVVTVNEFNRYVSENKAESLPIPPSAMDEIVPRASADYPRRRLMPADDTDDSLVFFCRRVYDFHGKRLLRNTSV